MTSCMTAAAYSQRHKMVTVETTEEQVNTGESVRVSPVWVSVKSSKSACDRRCLIFCLLFTVLCVALLTCVILLTTIVVRRQLQQQQQQICAVEVASAMTAMSTSAHTRSPGRLRTLHSLALPPPSPSSTRTAQEHIPRTTPSSWLAVFRSLKTAAWLSSNTEKLQSTSMSLHRDHRRQKVRRRRPSGRRHRARLTNSNSDNGTMSERSIELRSLARIALRRHFRRQTVAFQ